MSVIWIATFVAGATAIFVLTSWRQHTHIAELGTVSEQWLAEHRANDRHASER